MNEQIFTANAQLKQEWLMYRHTGAFSNFGNFNDSIDLF